MRHAIDASDAERRRIAAELHDGAVQEIAGQAMSLAVLADRREREGDTQTAGHLRDAASAGRRAVHELRSMLVDLYPPTLSSDGIAAAIDELVSRLQAEGLQVQVATDIRAPIPEDLERLAFRVCREALRNVEHHADATRVRIDLKFASEALSLTVRDNGKGFTSEERKARRDGGHLGLELLGALVDEAGGSLEVTPSPIGTAVILRVAAI